MVVRNEPISADRSENLGGRFGERRISGGACNSLGFLHCPATVPIALTAVARAGSRSVKHWAMLLEEGLLERLELLRNQLLQLLPKMRDARGRLIAAIPHQGAGELAVEIFRDYMTTLRNNEVYWLGCDRAKADEGVRRSGWHLHKGVVAADLSHSPTCCRTGAGRLQVLVVRHPFARFWSTFEQAMRGYTGPVEMAVFERWATLLFALWPERWACRHDRSLAEGCAGVAACVDPPFCDVPPWVDTDVASSDVPGIAELQWSSLVPTVAALRAAGRRPEAFTALRLEDPVASVARVAEVLCAKFDYCPKGGLPPFPAADPHERPDDSDEVLVALEGRQPRYWDDLRCLGAKAWPPWLVRGLVARYGEDLDAFGYSSEWIPERCGPVR